MSVGWRGLRIAPSGRGVDILLGDDHAWLGLVEGAWEARSVSVEDDEIAMTFMAADAILTLRHTFADAWTLRASVAPGASGAAPAVEVTARGGDGLLWWLWPGGNEGLLALAPTRSSGPCVVWRLRRGTVTGRQGAVVLPAVPTCRDQRTSTTWRGDLLPTLTAARQLLPRWWPTRTAVEHGDVIELFDPDLACHADAPVLVRTVADLTELTAPAGSYPVSVHTGGATACFDACWAPTLDDVTGSVVDTLLCADKLSDAAQWVLVAQALHDHRVASPAAAQELLDRSLDVLRPGSPLVIDAWCLEVARRRRPHAPAGERAGDAVDQLDGAVAGVWAVPGAASACLRAAGVLTVHGRELAAVDTALGMMGRMGVSSTTDWLTTLECRLLLAPDTVTARELDGALNLMGAALPGWTIAGRELGMDDTAAVLAVLSLVPDQRVTPDLAEVTTAVRSVLLARVHDLVHRMEASASLSRPCVEAALATLSIAAGEGG